MGDLTTITTIDEKGRKLGAVVQNCTTITMIDEKDRKLGAVVPKCISPPSQ